MTSLRLDHLAVACCGLAEGVAAVEAALGVPLAPGGEHATMGTHNRLLSLGPEEYLEVIAINPDAPPPGHPRWFDLDRFAGAPRLANWICRTEDLAGCLGQSPGAGLPMELARGDLRWSMAVPESGILPFDNRFPALIQWHGTAHPAARLPDRGVRLVALEIAHPDAPGLRAALAPLVDDPRLSIRSGATAMHATFATPAGERRL